MKARRLVQRQAGRGHDRAAERERRPVRLCLRRRAARLPARQGRPDDGGDVHHRRSAARLCRADRRQRQHADPGQGHPPRVPPRRRRRVQLAPGQALERPDQVARLLPGELRGRAEARARAPDRIILEANVEEKPTGELQLSAGFSSLESFILNASIQQRNFRGRARRSASRQLFELFEERSSSASPSPMCSTGTFALGFDIYRRDYQQLQLRQQRPQHDLQADHHRRPAPRRACR